VAFKIKIVGKFCATGERGIDHEEVQSNKTAERLGLLTIEVQAFLRVPDSQATMDRFCARHRLQICQRVGRLGGAYLVM